ncbi:hypothetical protein AKJ65_07200 [candidate division MSBL1 archaeon SCGC-AAA259E19]|uniref:Polymerase beta nucleotidyltransferase domain-containing protein n=1 Tax=candidate division MSBL1 archaeon SCGC-AAA259E19 TaxID=1698264 RepID=A0A133UEQ9_9EURY|nr:hypothetical protein AKJ65_07200 [candidate division MSBL1 archaeon SCGC-AAA259E19]
MEAELALEKAVNRIKETDREKKVQFIILFGSSARGDSTDLSDIDLAVGYDGNERERFDFRIKISGELPQNFDVQIFQDLPLYLKKEVLKGEVLFARDFGELHELALDVIREYDMFEPNFLDYVER